MKKTLNEMFSFIKNHATFVGPDIQLHESRALSKKIRLNNFDVVNEKAHAWEKDHPGFNIAVLGEDFDQIVVYKTSVDKNALEEAFTFSPTKYENFLDWRADVVKAYGNVEGYQDQLEAQMKIVEDFDHLCKELADSEQINE